MRSHEFTFKKTKRVKQVVEHRALSIDLTEQEASDLLELLGSVSERSEARTETYDPLYETILGFFGGRVGSSAKCRVVVQSRDAKNAKNLGR